MLTFAIFGIHNSALRLAVELVILFLVVIWLALIYWTYADARRRIADPLLIGCATLLRSGAEDAPLRTATLQTLAAVRAHCSTLLIAAATVAAGAILAVVALHVLTD